MPHVHANGIDINIDIHGPPDAPVVMFSNSLLTDYRMWDAQVPALADRYRILRYDTRGHGRTQATPPPYSMPMLTSDAVALLDALGIERVHFVGLSMGGMIGQLFASAHPDRVMSLSLCDTACRMPPASVWDERIVLARTRGTSAFITPITTRWLTQQYRDDHPEVVETLGAMIANTSVDGMVGCCAAISTMDHLALLSRIGAPTLVVVGEHDIGTPVSAARTLQKEIRDSELAVIQNAAHLTNIEQAGVFNKIITRFVYRASEKKI